MKINDRKRVTYIFRENVLMG